VLVAEDHPVNQELVARILEKRGHTWRIAKTGKEALEFLAGEKFDVVLMDAQMPEMNGLEATRLHREREKSTGEHVPIFALTAHALAGDRERCLEAGMDGYLAKPVNSHKLISLVETMTGISDAPIAQDAEAASASAIFDQGELSERTGGNTALMKRVARIFLHDYPAKLRAIERSILRRDASALARAAHALKGSAATLAAHATASAARALEDLGNDGDLARGQDLLSQLKSECGRFAGVLRSSVLKEKSARKAAEKKSRPRSRAKIRR
jgi:CheY-like chemotaxis protein